MNTFSLGKKSNCHLSRKINRYPLVYFENPVTSCITPSHLPKSICVFVDAVWGVSIFLASLFNYTAGYCVLLTHRHPNYYHHCAAHSMRPLHCFKIAFSEKFPRRLMVSLQIAFLKRKHSLAVRHFLCFT